MAEKRTIGTLGMLFASIGGILGSGWLFGPLYAAQLAGPASLVAWTIGGFAMILIALTFAELGAMLPINGGIARHALFSYGRTSGFLISLCAWLTFIVITATEVQAVMQYSTIYLPFLTERTPDHSHPLTTIGYACAAGLWIIFALINWIGIRLFSVINNWLTWLKIVLIIVVSIALYSLAFDFKNLDDIKEGGFAPMGMTGIFQALAYGGVIYAFTGFQHSSVAAGDSRNPQRDIPLAAIGSIVICLVFYLLIQLAFLGALGGDSLSHGWKTLQFKDDVGPLAGLAMKLGAGWLFIVIFVGAIASPLGCGMINLGSCQRLTRGMSHDGFVPRRLGRIGRFHTPPWAIAITFPIGLFLFLPFPGWQELVAFLATVVVLAYAVGPIGVMALRRQLPDQQRPFHLPMAGVICPIAFIICGLLMHWAGWTIVWKLTATVLGTGLIFVLLQVGRKPLDLREACWIPLLLLGIATLTLLGTHGGLGYISPWINIGLVAAWCLVVYGIAWFTAIPPEETRMHVNAAFEADQADYDAVLDTE
ncbi:MAG: APC family permease [Phycisphaerales bacterium]|nr:APC family permease [Phycisphaerales bacterium]